MAHEYELFSWRDRHTCCHLDFVATQVDSAGGLAAVDGWHWNIVSGPCSTVVGRIFLFASNTALDDTALAEWDDRFIRGSPRTGLESPRDWFPGIHDPLAISVGNAGQSVFAVGIGLEQLRPSGTRFDLCCDRRLHPEDVNRPSGDYGGLQWVAHDRRHRRTELHHHFPELGPIPPGSSERCLLARPSIVSEHDDVDGDSRCRRRQCRAHHRDGMGDAPLPNGILHGLGP